MQWINEILAKEIKTIQVEFKNENFEESPNTVTEIRGPDQKINSDEIIIISQNNNLHKDSIQEHISTHHELDANGFAVIDYKNQYYVLTTSNFIFESSENNNKQPWNTIAYPLKNINELQTFLKNGEMLFYEPVNANIKETIKECLAYEQSKNIELAPKKAKQNKM